MQHVVAAWFGPQWATRLTGKAMHFALSVGAEAMHLPLAFLLVEGRVEVERCHSRVACTHDRNETSFSAPSNDRCLPFCVYGRAAV